MEKPQVWFVRLFKQEILIIPSKLQVTIRYNVDRSLPLIYSTSIRQIAKKKQIAKINKGQVLGWVDEITGCFNHHAVYVGYKSWRERIHKTYKKYRTCQLLLININLLGLSITRRTSAR